MHRKILSYAFFFASLLCTLTTLIHAQVIGRVFTVDSTADTVDANPGDGACADANSKCTLRAAIQEANSNAANRDAIVFALPNPSVIELTLGELAITGKVAIVGPGARRLSVERSSTAGTPEFRIFRIASGVTNVIIRGLKIRKGNLTTGEGGGFLIEGLANVKLSDLWVDQNFTASSGGGIKNLGTVSVSRSLFTSNTANQGGAVENAQSGNATIINSTFYQNTGATAGAIKNSGTLLLANDTFAENSATGECSSICNEATATTLNTIFGRDSISPSHALKGDFTSIGNNIVVDPASSTGFTNGVNNDQVSDASGTVDPKLGTLANNGGETDTMELLSGSPAIDRGNDCVTNGSCSAAPNVRMRTDQRGRFRGFFNTVDVGAFEVNNSVTSTIWSLTFASFGTSNRHLGSFAILTNAVTNDKRYFPLKPSGAIKLQAIPSGVYVLEVKTKRAGLGFDPFVIATEDVPSLSFANPEAGLDLTFTTEIVKP